MALVGFVPGEERGRVHLGERRVVEESVCEEIPQTADDTHGGHVAHARRALIVEDATYIVGEHGEAIAGGRGHGPVPHAVRDGIDPGRGREPMGGQRVGVQEDGQVMAVAGGHHVPHHLLGRRRQLAADGSKSALPVRLDANPTAGSDSVDGGRGGVVVGPVVGRDVLGLARVVEEIGVGGEPVLGREEAHRIAVGQGQAVAAVEDRRPEGRLAQALERCAVDHIEVDHGGEAEVEVAPGELPEVARLQLRVARGLRGQEARDFRKVHMPVDEAGYKPAAGAFDDGQPRRLGRRRGVHAHDAPVAHEDVGMRQRLRPLR